MTGGFGVTCLRLVLVSTALTVHPIFSSFLVVARRHYRYNNKDVFLDLGVCKQFLYPKVHSLLHYRSSITLFGTTDNYNTEQTERLHIDLTKDAYNATNHKDEYPQMTAWLERHEKVTQHMLFIAWRQRAQQEGTQSLERIGPPKPVPRAVQMS